MNRILVVLETTDVETASSVEELLIARSQLKTIGDGYQDLKLETPEWVAVKLALVEREIGNRVRDEWTLRLRKAEARRSALKTRDEMRAFLDKEIEDLKKKLA